MKKKKIFDLIIFIISSLCLFISIKLFYNVGIFCDTFNTSPVTVNGGNLWLALDWARLFLLGGTCIISLINLARK